MTHYLLNVPLLQELRAMLGDELGDVTGLFIEQLGGQIGDIVACHGRGDLPNLSALAHGLKGSAANMGAVALSQSAGSIEKQALVADSAALAPLVAALPALAAQTIAELRGSGFAPVA